MSEPRILAVGSYEDTAIETLKVKGYSVEEVDPNVNGLDLDEFYKSPGTVSQSYDMILSVSVLEHVPDDRAFVRTLAALLAPGGVAILTVDFSNAYPMHGLKPDADHRLYTKKHLLDLMAAIPDCALIDPQSWDDGEDDFEFMGYHYAFASLVFRKLDTSPARHLSTIGGNAPWKALLRKEKTRMSDAQPLPAGNVPYVSPPTPVSRSVKRRVALAIYGFVRPVVHPIALRARAFLTADIHRRLDAMQAEHERLITLLDHIDSRGTK
jgi:SAM-dependent methyltransferase